MEGNLLTKTAELAMTVTLQYVREGDFVIDATCGNGHDTLALSKACGEQGSVLAVDLQEQAIRNSRRLLSGEGVSNTTFVHGDFLYLENYVTEHFSDKRPRAVVFNLGYLPGGDKSVTTTAESSAAAVRQALSLIEPGGIVMAVLYWGHTEGKKERDAVLHLAQTLSPKEYHAAYTSFPNQKKNPPEVLWITKKRQPLEAQK